MWNFQQLLLITLFLCEIFKIEKLTIGRHHKTQFLYGKNAVICKKIPKIQLIVLGFLKYSILSD